jgi:hypothetical protein
MHLVVHIDGVLLLLGLQVHLLLNGLKALA